jgi:hypothetical protein
MIYPRMAMAAMMQSEARRRRWRKRNAAATHLVVTALERVYGVRPTARGTSRKTRTKPTPMDWADRWSRLSEADWRQRYRMGKQTFTQLVDAVRPHLRPTRDLTPEVIISATLRWCAGASYWDVLDMHGMAGTGTLHLRIWEVLEIIDEVFTFPLLEAIIALERPETNSAGLQALQEMADTFERKTSGVLKGCVGAIDGIAIKITKPKDAVKHWCRKGFYSLNVQAICDQEHRITWLSTVACGSTHDVQALQCSWLGEHIFSKPERAFNNSGFCVFGDAAYRGIANRCRSLITPYDDAEVTVMEDSFNYYHSSSRMSVEGTFGEFSQRWGVLWRPLRVAEDHATLLLSALAKVHNLCVDGGHRAPTRCVGQHRGDVDHPVEKYVCIAPDGSRRLATAYPDYNVAERYYDGAGNRLLGRYRPSNGQRLQPIREEMNEALAEAGMSRPSTSQFSYRNRNGTW